MRVAKEGHAVLLEALHAERRYAQLLEQAFDLIEAMLAEKREVVALPEEGIALEEIERLAIVAALRRTGGKQAAAARLLGITPRVMCYKVRAHGIDVRQG